MRAASQTMTGEIEQTVTYLLRTTKSLLESLNQWSVQRIPKTAVFELHEALEKQFFLVVQAFEEVNVPMSDLQWIPGRMRELVTLAMMEIPSPAALDQHLPHIREVIVQLLQGLKAKQALLRESRVRSSDSWNSNKEPYLNRTSSTGSRMMYPSSPPLPPASSPRLSNASNYSNSEYDPWTGGMPRPSVPTNDLSSRIVPPQPIHSNPTSPSLSNVQLPMESSPVTAPNRENTFNHSSSLNSKSAYASPPPPQPPYQRPHSPSEPQVYPPPPPPPPPQPPLAREFDENDPSTADALAALKQQENLARRSSVRRTSMYRGGGNGSQRENNMGLGGKQKHSHPEGAGGSGDNLMSPPVPNLPTMSKKRQRSRLGVVSEAESTNEKEEKEEEEEEEEEVVAEKDIILFLQLGKQVKKITYNGEISLPALNMLFLEKFSYSSKQHDFPQIYIRDPEVGVSYELMDLKEIKHNSVLSLNIDENEEQKDIQKEILAELNQTFTKELSDTRRVFTEQLDKLKLQIVESSQATDEKLQSIKLDSEVSIKDPTDTTAQVQKTSSISKTQLDRHLKEIQTLRRDILTLRQLESEMREQTADVVKDIKEKASNINEMTAAAAAAAAATTNQISSVARSRLEQGKTTLLEKSDKVTTRLEELQDTVDQIKLDITQRKCRPSETQMIHCTSERKALDQEIKEFGDYITNVKPGWKKIWEQELQNIVKEQQTLKDQEYLLSDMKEDLDALHEVFGQLEKITVYQAKTKPVAREFRVASVDDGFEGMSSVFKQVASIDVDHDRRLRAMEQADKMRQRELANRIDDFEKELVNFVDTKKLKKTGGAAEIDRLRKQKEEDMLKEMYKSEKKPSNSDDE